MSAQLSNRCSRKPTQDENCTRDRCRHLQAKGDNLAKAQCKGLARLLTDHMRICCRVAWLLERQIHTEH